MKFQPGLLNINKMEDFLDKLTTFWSCKGAMEDIFLSMYVTGRPYKS